MRLHLLKKLADETIFKNKNEIGLIIDLLSSCLNADPSKRPTIRGLLQSPLFIMDRYESLNAQWFSQNVILYRSPISTVSERITLPLRNICSLVLRQPDSIISLEETILKFFDFTKDSVTHVTTLPLDELKMVLTETEKIS